MGAGTGMWGNRALCMSVHVDEIHSIDSNMRNGL